MTAVHCEHFSTHLVTGDGREDVLVRPGYELSVMIPSTSTLVSLSSSAGSSFMAEDRGNSCVHVVGAPPDDDNVYIRCLSVADRNPNLTIILTRGRCPRGQVSGRRPSRGPPGGMTWPRPRTARPYIQC